MTWLTIHDLRPLLNSPKPYGRGYLALCPFHQDDCHSLHVGPDNGFHCYGCARNGNLLALMTQLKSVGGEYRSRKPKRARGGGRKQEYTPLTLTSQYIYTNEMGKTLYRVIRYTPKAFRQERYFNGGWIPNMHGVQRVMYKLPDILSRPDDIVVIVEGEKDADNLHELGLLATTTVGGANGFSKTDTRCLTGRLVAIIQDNDAGGDCYRDRIERGLAGVAARVVSVGLWDRQHDGRDVTDWLEDHTIDELKELIDAAMGT